MDLNDYENDPYAPRPDASKLVAAQHRAQPHDPEPTQPLSTNHTQHLITGIVGVLTVIGVFALAIAQYSLSGPKPLVTPQVDTPLSIPAPLKTALSASEGYPTSTPVLIRKINAYAAPDGLLLGQIDADRAIVPIAHYGNAWIAYQDGAGLVWLRKSDVPDVALTGPDLAPVAAQPERGPVVNNWTPPEATSAPDKGTKAAPDRAARYATAVARDRQPHGSK